MLLLKCGKLVRLKHVMRLLLLVITTFLIVASCQTNESFQADSFQLLLPDTSKTHIPNSVYEHLKGFSRQMGLPSIDTGAKEFELRIWTGSMLDPDQMVLLRKVDSVTIAQKFDYKSYIDTLKHYKLTKTYQHTTLTKFVDSLQEIDFRTMPSQNEIAGFKDNVADGVTYHLELATPKYYKLVTYHCPEHFAKSEVNNKKFLDLILAIDRYLHFYSPVCSF